MINHESFPGFDWNSSYCDELAIRHVPITLLSRESELFTTKHWDYRFLHPTQATQLFAHSYAQAKKHAVERRTDIWVGRNMKGMKEEIIFDQTTRAITGFWKGRQMADSLGIPYDFYCEHCMVFADIARWENLPTPVQTYSENVPEHLRTTDYAVSMVTYIANRWIDRMGTANAYATHRAYLLENYVGGPEQIAYREFLLDRIQESNYPEAVLASLMDKGQIGAEQVIHAFPRSGASLVRRAEVLRS